MIRWFGAIRVESDRKALSQVLDLPALLFGELFASLGGLANFLSDYFPLVGVVVFDSLHQGCTEIADLVFRELGVVHVFVPMFFTLPSVRRGKVFAISLQLLPASRSVLSRCSSAGVQGVFVRPFFGNGLGSVWADGRPRSTSPPGLAENGPCGFPKALTLLLEEPGMDGSLSSEARRLRTLTGEGS